MVVRFDFKLTEAVVVICLGAAIALVALVLAPALQRSIGGVAAFAILYGMLQYGLASSRLRHAMHSVAERVERALPDCEDVG